MLSYPDRSVFRAKLAEKGDPQMMDPKYKDVSADFLRRANEDLLHHVHHALHVLHELHVAEARARRRHVRVERHVSGHKFGDAIRVGEEDETAQRFLMITWPKFSKGS